MLAGVAVGSVLLAISAKRSSAASPAGGPGGVFQPTTPPPTPAPAPSSRTVLLPEVIGRMTAAVATRDPVALRAEAARLRADGWPNQAKDLEEAASRLEGLQQQPVPLPAPVPLPPLSPASSTSPLPGIIPPSNPSPPPPAPVVRPAPVPAAPAPSSPRTTLRAGNTGADVSAWQATLNTFGFGLAVDGNFGSGTTSATRDFQTDMGVQVDGVAGPETFAAVGRAPMLGRRVLKLGSKGPAVKSWQIALVADGLNSPTGGVFDAETEARTKQYQAARGLTADGIVGPLTIAAIGPRLPAAAAAAVATTIDPDSWRTLRRGMSGADVGQWQLVLTRDGHPVTVDGDFGPVTESATIAWQRQRGLTADGIVGPASRAKIAANPAGARVAGDVDLATNWRPLRASTPLPGLMAPEAPSEEVAAERVLAAQVAHNLFFSPPEGEDRELVAQFQQLNGLNVTGAYGPATAEALIAFGFVPPRVRYWPSKGSTHAKAKYRSVLQAQARRDKPRAAEWNSAARAVEM